MVGVFKLYMQALELLCLCNTECEGLLYECRTAISDAGAVDGLLTRTEYLINNRRSFAGCFVRLWLRGVQQYTQLVHMRQELLDTQAILRDLPAESSHRVIFRTHSVGRPSVFISDEQVQMLRQVRCTWAQIADCLHINRSTLWRRFRGYNNSRHYTDISDADLDHVVSDIQSTSPNIRRSLMYGYLLSRGVHVQLYHVRDSMRRVSPIECSIRWHQVLRRRQYCVPGPNSLWHIDGHHSLIRWRFVIHGGIDGYSRYITYLHCNKQSSSHSF